MGTSLFDLIQGVYMYLFPTNNSAMHQLGQLTETCGIECWVASLLEALDVF